MSGETAKVVKHVGCQRTPNLQNMNTITCSADYTIFRAHDRVARLMNHFTNTENTKISALLAVNNTPVRPNTSNP